MLDVRTGSHEIDVLTLRVAGRLDALEAAGLRRLLEGHLQDGQANIAVDLTDLEFLDSAGLAALVMGMKTARAAGGDLRLVWPSSADAMRIFELTSFDQVFTHATSMDDLLSQW